MVSFLLYTINKILFIISYFLYLVIFKSGKLFTIQIFAIEQHSEHILALFSLVGAQSAGAVFAHSVALIIVQTDDEILFRLGRRINCHLSNAPQCEFLTS